jgi:hypothetical protein
MEPPSTANAQLEADELENEYYRNLFDLEEFLDSTERWRSAFQHAEFVPVMPAPNFATTAYIPSTALSEELEERMTKEFGNYIKEFEHSDNKPQPPPQPKYIGVVSDYVNKLTLRN